MALARIIIIPKFIFRGKSDRLLSSDMRGSVVAATADQPKFEMVFNGAILAGLLKANFVPEGLRQYRKRIKQQVSGEILASAATQQAIAAVQAVVMAALMIPVMIAATSN